jgi:protein involved in polysaccharide export with SLBB domain
MRRLFSALIFASLLPLGAGSDSPEQKAVDDTLGFGFQPILVNPKVNDTKKILGSTVYKLTPGDTYELVVKIDQIERTNLVLPPDYRLELPSMGTWDVRGMSFSELRSRIITSFKSRFVVDFVDFTLISPAIFDVFVYGGVESPGFVTVTSLARLHDALAATKGIKSGASYRRVLLLREEQIITCDMYRFVREGDFSQNPHLEPGDKINVPHPQILASVEGMVKYPQTFELVAGESLMDLINMAGGLTPGALESGIEVVRFKQSAVPADAGPTVVMPVPLSQAGDFPIQHGDRVRILSALDNPESVTVEGALFGKPTGGPGAQAVPASPILVSAPFYPGLTLLRLLETFGGPTSLADGSKSHVMRETGSIAVDVGELWETRDPGRDIPLEPGDHVLVPMMRLEVTVAGEVNLPGSFTYRAGDRVSTYLAAAGGVNPETGDTDRIFILGEDGRRVRAGLDEEVPPATVIYVDQNSWERTNRAIDNTLVVLGFASSIISLIVSVINLIALF